MAGQYIPHSAKRRARKEKGAGQARPTPSSFERKIVLLLLNRFLPTKWGGGRRPADTSPRKRGEGKEIRD
jgi:hypothetical protein